MKKKSIFKCLFTCWIVATAFSSCNEIDLSNISKDIAIDESLLIPAGETTITIQDVLTKTGTNDVKIEGNEVNFVSEKDLDYSFRKIDLLKYSAEKTVTVKPWGSYPGSVPVPAGTTVPTSTITDSVSLGINDASRNPGERIEYVEINLATIGLVLNLTNDIKNSIRNDDISITIHFPNNTVTNFDGSAYKDIIIVPNSYGTVKNIVLSNFIMHTPGGASGIPVEVSVSARTSLATTASNNSAFNCTLSFNQIAFKTVWGHFSPDSNSKDSLRISLNLPTSLSAFNLKFANPAATITVTSTVGAKLKFNVDYVKAFDKDNVEIAKAKFAAGTDTYGLDDQSHTFHIAKPVSTSQSSTTTILLDKDNGSTDLLFASGKIPDALEYKFSSGVETDLSSLDFILPDSKIAAHVSVKIPMILNAGSSIELLDTIKNVGKNLNSSMKDVNVDSVSLVLAVTNHFPLPAKLEIVNPVDSLGKEVLKDFVKEYSIDAATLNSDGTVQKEQLTTFIIKLKKGQYDEVKRMSNLYLKVSLGDKSSTTQAHILKDDYIKIKLSGYAKGTITGTLGSSK
jgi:hypothetical protein